MPYVGFFDVQGGDFNLNAERFIVRERENVISFLFTGDDEYGEFKMEGVANITAHDFYRAENCEIIRTNYAAADRATIIFRDVDENDDHTTCDVVGSWNQEGDEWRFTGLLRIV